jgi:hypothetical protein
MSGATKYSTENDGRIVAESRNIFYEVKSIRNGIATVLSFFLPGLGQIFNGRLDVGIPCSLLWMVLFSLYSRWIINTIVRSGMETNYGPHVVAGLVLLTLWATNIYDAKNNG